jgi:ribosomal protein L29
MTKFQAIALYEKDLNLWVEQTVQLLHQRRFDELDVENLIDEIESIGKRDKRELRSRLIVLLTHLLKYQYQPEQRSKSWLNTIREQRRQIALLLTDSPSLKPYLDEVLAECYANSRMDAADETDLPLDTFPVDCPFVLEECLNSDFLSKLTL